MHYGLVWYYCIVITVQDMFTKIFPGQSAKITIRSKHICVPCFFLFQSVFLIWIDCCIILQEILFMQRFKLKMHTSSVSELRFWNLYFICLNDLNFLSAVNKILRNFTANLLSKSLPLWILNATDIGENVVCHHFS